MKGSISSGGSCRSMSMGTMTSPRAWSMPAVSAASLPKLRDRLTILRRRPSAARANTRAKGVVGRAVIDEDDLEAKAVALHQGRHRVEEEVDRLLLVEHRH